MNNGKQINLHGVTKMHLYTLSVSYVHYS